jgi:hypothetical protein
MIHDEEAGCRVRTEKYFPTGGSSILRLPPCYHSPPRRIFFIRETKIRADWRNQTLALRFVFPSLPSLTSLAQAMPELWRRDTRRPRGSPRITFGPLRSPLRHSSLLSDFPSSSGSMMGSFSPSSRVCVTQVPLPQTSSALLTGGMGG